ncbi:hypothetical protein ACSQ67_020848 [Phaseolus vulgaris]
MWNKQVFGKVLEAQTLEMVTIDEATLLFEEIEYARIKRRATPTELVSGQEMRRNMVVERNRLPWGPTRRGKLQAYEGKDGQMKAILKRRLFGSSFEGEGSVGRAGYAGGEVSIEGNQAYQSR